MNIPQPSPRCVSGQTHIAFPGIPTAIGGSTGNGFLSNELVSLVREEVLPGPVLFVEGLNLVGIHKNKK